MKNKVCETISDLGYLKGLDHHHIIIRDMCVGIVYYAELFVIFIAIKLFPVKVNLFVSRKGAIILAFFSAFPNT